MEAIGGSAESLFGTLLGHSRHLALKSLEYFRFWIATVERREASVLRHKRVHARLTTHYGTQGASHAPGPPRHVRAPTDAAASVRLSALRPPLGGGNRIQNSGAIAPRARRGLFDK